MKIFIELVRIDEGGIKTSLINFLNNMCDENEIDLCVLNRNSKQEEDIPKKVNIVENKSFQFKVNEDVKIIDKKHVFKSFIYKTKRAFNQLKKYLNIFLLKKNQKLYDVSICYCSLYTDAKYILSKTKAKCRCLIYHGDIINVPFNKRQERIFSKFDKLFFVSKSCAEVAKVKYPRLKNKIAYLYNMQNNERVLQNANAFGVDFKNYFNIVTAARIMVEKGQLRMLTVLKKLHKEGYKFVWHLVGDGPYEELVKNYVFENKMEDYVKFYGFQKNPYPFIKKADLFLLCSHHEAAPMVFGESMLLQTPVLSTRTRSADELVGEWGYVCENSEQSLYDVLKYILENPQDLAEKKKNLKNYTYDNEKIKQHFYKEINGEKQ